MRCTDTKIGDACKPGLLVSEDILTRFRGIVRRWKRAYLDITYLIFAGVPTPRERLLFLISLMKTLLARQVVSQGSEPKKKETREAAP